MVSAQSIEPGAILGFHAPSLPVKKGLEYSGEEVERAFAIAMKVMQVLYDILLTENDDFDPINNFLYGRILNTPASEMYTIDTIAEAIMTDINVGIWLPEKITRASMVYACENALMLWRGIDEELGDADEHLDWIRNARYYYTEDQVKYINNEYWAVRLYSRGRYQMLCLFSDEGLASRQDISARLVTVSSWPDEPAEAVWQELSEGILSDLGTFELDGMAFYDGKTPLSDFQ
ncbi:MAG: hypothetical protein ABJK75_00020 [Tateyamaria sp.]